MTKIKQIAANLGTFSRAMRSQGGVVALFLVLILGLFVLKLPTWLLDILLIINLLLALTVFLRGIFLDRRADFYSFPMLLVVTTLFRLALNVSSTKLILLQGEQGPSAAGEVIRTLGQVAVRGDFVVGSIVFAIIAVVNFLVITKGAARVAEVAARFSLDALPGRQLSIDSDFRSGVIGKDQANNLRKELDRQSQFFGSMDGAMKWVQGDAVASLVITLINAVGGIALGVARGLSFGEAVDVFGILAIGDGLVSILPSLLISVAAGMVLAQASNSASDDSGGTMLMQLLSDPRAPLGAGSAIIFLGALGLLGIIDVPAFPLILMGGLLLLFVGSRNWLLDSEGQVVVALPGITGGFFPQTSGRSSARVTESGIDFAKQLGVTPLEIEADGQLFVGVFDLSSKTATLEGELLAQAQALQERIFRKRGIGLPLPQLRIVNDIEAMGYRIFVRGRLVRKGTLNRQLSLVVLNEGVSSIMGLDPVKTDSHPLDQRRAVWTALSDTARQSLNHLSVEVLAPSEYLLLQAMSAVLERAEDLVGVVETKQMVASLAESDSGVVEEIFVKGAVSYPECAELLRRLVRERVSIRDFKQILEAVAEFIALNPRTEKRQDWLSELHSFVRVVLAKNIVEDALAPGDILRAFVLSPSAEEEFRAAVAVWDQVRTVPPLEPDFEQALRRSAWRLFSPVLERGVSPIVIICSGEVRAAVQEFMARQFPTADWVRTIAFQELDSPERPEVVGVLGVEV